MSPHSIAFLIVLILAVLIAIVIHRLLRPGLRGLLDDVVALPAATEFYLRAFALVLILVALAAVAGARPDVKEGAHFMEYVWAVSGGLQEVLQGLFIILLVYVGLVTVLTAALRRKH